MNKEEYSVSNGCLYRGLRIVVPPSLRQQILSRFHAHHPGIVKMRQLLRNFVWWPGLDGDVQKFVSKCESCVVANGSRDNQQLPPWSECQRFFQRVFIDICFFENQQFLVLVDQFSGFVDVHILPKLSSDQVIRVLQIIFKYFGPPEQLVCDNGKQFTSQNFREFLTNNHVELVLTPPYHSQSNGRVERANRTFKLFLIKNAVHNNWHHWVCHFVATNNFFPNANGLVPSKEYLKISPRRLMKDVLVIDKHDCHAEVQPQFQLGSTVVPLESGRAHAGSVIDASGLRRSSRSRRPNPKYC